ncbi:hypothetical protein AGR56_02550 [Clostridium sp. DMHC 10]|nr:hypothetical protein AGR56_02550 [Clostridium sp. DMHC 10]
MYAIKYLNSSKNKDERRVFNFALLVKRLTFFTYITSEGFDIASLVKSELFRLKPKVKVIFLPLCCGKIIKLKIFP